jgi:large subunit ribosomal protein L30
MAKKKAESAKVKVTLVKSTIGSLEKHIKTVEALGLKKVGSSKIFNDNPALRGMLFVVQHLVKVEEVGAV